LESLFGPRKSRKVSVTEEKSVKEREKDPEKKIERPKK
jgi:hypothetical protein